MRTEARGDADAGRPEGRECARARSGSSWRNRTPGLGQRADRRAARRPSRSARPASRNASTRRARVRSRGPRGATRSAGGPRSTTVSDDVQKIAVQAERLARGARLTSASSSARLTDMGQARRPGSNRRRPMVDGVNPRTWRRSTARTSRFATGWSRSSSRIAEDDEAARPAGGDGHLVGRCRPAHQRPARTRRRVGAADAAGPSRHCGPRFEQITSSMGRA